MAELTKENLDKVPGERSLPQSYWEIQWGWLWPDCPRGGLPAFVQNTNWQLSWSSLHEQEGVHPCAIVETQLGCWTALTGACLPCVPTPPTSINALTHCFTVGRAAVVVLINFIFFDILLAVPSLR